MDYRSLPSCQQKWTRLAETFSPHVTQETLGHSVENRPLVALRITHTDPANPHAPRPRLLINSLQHAREWLTVPAATYVVEQLALHVSKDNDPLATLLRHVEVIVLPMLNPDGYVYSRIDNDTRTARKNRRLVGCDRDRYQGVDLNRNWGVDYNGSENADPTDMCSDQFIGTAAFSEPETRAVRDFVERTDRIIAHLDLHAFGGLVLGAWSYTEEEPRDLHVVESVGRTLASDMTGQFGVNYKFSRGGKNSLLYAASGVMTDWTFDKGIMSFTVELRPRGEASMAGFELPREQILESCVELFAGMRNLMRYVNDTDVIADAPLAEESKPDRSGDSEVSYISPLAFVLVGIAVCALLVTVVAVLSIVVMSRRRRNVLAAQGARGMASDVEMGRSKAIDDAFDLTTSHSEAAQFS